MCVYGAVEQIYEISLKVEFLIFVLKFFNSTFSIDTCAGVSQLKVGKNKKENEKILFIVEEALRNGERKYSFYFLRINLRALFS
jgi:hypothetical protein